MTDDSEKSGVDLNNPQSQSEGTFTDESDSTEDSSSAEGCCKYDSDNRSFSTQEELSFESDDDDCYHETSKHACASLSKPVYTSLEFRDGINYFCLHPKDENLVGVCSGHLFSLWNIKENSICAQKELEDFLFGFEFSYDGEFIYLADNRRNHYVLQTNNLEILRKTCRDDIYICHWHPLRQLLLMATLELGILIISFPEHKIRIMEYEFEWFDLFAFFPSGDRVLGAFRCGKFCIWDLESLETIFTFIDKEGKEDFSLVDNIEINKSGTIAAYSYCRFRIKIISLFDGSLLAHIPYGVHNYETYGVTLAFSDDDNYLAAGNGIGEVYVIATCSFQVQSKFKNRYKACISELHWNNRTLFVGFRDGYVRSIDIITGKLIKEFHCHSKSMCNSQLFKHENKFITGSEDKTIKIFGF